MKPFKIVFYPHTAKPSSKTLRIPIYMRVSKGTKKVEASLNASITEEELKFWNPFTQRLEIEGNTVNKVLEDINYEFSGLPYRFKDFMDFSPNDVKAKILKLEANLVTESMDALVYIENHFKTIVLPGKNYSMGTKRNYRKAINHFTNYLNLKKQTKVSLANFSSVLAFGFYDYLQTDVKETGKIAMTDVSASSVVIKIKAIFERAYDTELVKRNPFKKIRLQTKSKKREELSIDEISSLINLDLSKERTLEPYRDIFLFSVFTGLAYSDIYELNKEHIRMEQGEILLEKSRVKTGEQIKQVLITQAVAILKKYEDHIETQIENRVFPKRHLNKMNEYLKIIQARAGIKKLLTTHIARHTCSQMLADLGDINSDVINTMLGWSNRGEGSRIIYRRTSFIMLKDAKEKFENFLNQNLCKH
jgi:integrase